MNENKVEIEKKYIISMPDSALLESMPEYTVSDIVQIYLSSQKGITHRVRSRSRLGNTVYTETKKVRIDKMSAFEDEREICREEFEKAALNIAEGTKPIVKKRHTFVYKNQLFEIDVYPQWKSSAIMETELESRDIEVEFPSFIKILSDVTGNRRYSNASMAKSFPEE